MTSHCWALKFFQCSFPNKPRILRTFALNKISQSIDSYFLFLLQSDNDRVTCAEGQKKLRVTDFVLEIVRVKNFSDFEKLTDVIQHRK